MIILVKGIHNNNIYRKTAKTQQQQNAMSGIHLHHHLFIGKLITLKNYAVQMGVLEDVAVTCI